MGYFILGIFVFLAIFIIALYWSYNNKEISLRKKAIAQESNIAAVHDKMWKVIQQSAGVAKEYAERFNEIYKDIIAGRYAGQGTSFRSRLRPCVVSLPRTRKLCWTSFVNTKPCVNSSRTSSSFPTKLPLRMRLSVRPVPTM